MNLDDAINKREAARAAYERTGNAMDHEEWMLWDEVVHALGGED